MTNKELEKRKPISIIGETIPTKTEKKFSYQVETDVLLERILINTHQGQRYDLQYTIEISREDGGFNDVVTSLGQNNYLAGNGLKYDLEPRETLEEGDKINIYIENVNSNNDYTSSLVLEIERETNLFTERLNNLSDLI